MKISAFVILLSCISVLIFIDYIYQTRKRYTMTLDDLQNINDKGERLLNILEVFYIPTLIKILDFTTIPSLYIVVIGVATFLIITLQCRLHAYAKRIHALQKSK